jgi:diamine N-acetyltransferase
MTGTAAQRPIIRLVAVTQDNRAAVEALAVTDEQQRFVATNAASLVEADHDRDALPRAILSGERLVGFLMYDASDAADIRIYRFMIDRAFQGQGFGKAALGAVLEEIAQRHDGAGRVSIVYEPDNEAARRLYGAAGFVEEGLDQDAEMVAALHLDREERR